jgi:hypothetical protein
MGQVFSGGSSRPATAEELQSIGTLRQALSQLPVPPQQVEAETQRSHG